MRETAAFVIGQGMQNGIVFHGAARGQASVSIRRDAAQTKVTDSISPRRTGATNRPDIGLDGSGPPAEGETPTNGFTGSLARATGTVAEMRSDGGVPALDRRKRTKGRIAARPCAKARIGSSPGATRPGRHPPRRPPSAKRAPSGNARQRLAVSNDSPARNGRSQPRPDKPERT